MTGSGLRLVTYSWYHLVDRYLMFKCRRESEEGKERGVAFVVRNAQRPQPRISAFCIGGGEGGGQAGGIGGRRLHTDVRSRRTVPDLACS